MFSDYNLKFSQPSGACGEVQQRLETAKACGLNSTGTCFLQTFKLFRPSAIFVGLIPADRFLKAFFQNTTTPMLEMTEPRTSNPVGTCFFANSKFSSPSDFCACSLLLT